MPNSMPPRRGLISGARQLSRDAFEERVQRAAGGFAAAGLLPGDCVAILMRNDLPFLEASLAAMRIGAYAVPINWHFKSDEVGYILEDCAARILVGHADLIAGVQDAIPADVLVISVDVPEEVRAAYGLHRLAIDSAHNWEDWLVSAIPWSGPAIPATQSMLYTSGTTGHPKGVRRATPTPAQQAAIHAMREKVYGLKPGIRTVIPGPLYHSAPNAFALRAASIAEAVVLMPRFDAEGFLAVVERERIDCVFMVPTMFVRLLKLPHEVRRKYDVSSLRFVIHAAAPCPNDVKSAMIEWWGPVLYEFYGGTESGALTFSTSEEWIARPGTVGRPVDQCILRILDDDGQELPTGGVGEVYARLPYYPDFTYHNLPDRRAEVERDGLITCGDVGYLDQDGYLFLCDRKRDMVISGGVNIYPAEIEAVLITLEGVKDCAVFGIPDADFGESLLAVVEPQANTVIDPEALRSELARHLAGYKVPRRIEICTDLPREDSGKIFKRRLRDPYWQGREKAI